MFFQIKVSSKDKQVLNKFQYVFSQLQKDSSTWNVMSNFNKKEVITVLKSPHVNKTAQEQFEYRIFTKFFFINSFKPSSFLLMLKKLKSSSFSGITFKITKWSDNFKTTRKILFLLTPRNMVLKKKKFKKSNIDYLVLPKYVQLFDCYGEMLLKEKYFIK